MIQVSATSSISASSYNDRTIAKDQVNNNKDQVSNNNNDNHNPNSNDNNTPSHKIFIKMFKELILISRMKMMKMMGNMNLKMKKGKIKMIIQMMIKGLSKIRLKSLA